MSNHEPVDYGAVLLVVVLAALAAFAVVSMALSVIGRAGL